MRAASLSPTAIASCRSRCCLAATRCGSPPSPPGKAVSNGAPIATPASPIRRSQSISMPPQPAGGPGASERRWPPSSTSMSKSPSPRALPKRLIRRAARAGLKTGVVQDKLFLPGLRKLKKLYEAQFFGRVVGIRLDFGWWVFDGEVYPAQRPSWNYKKATGGGIVLDMFAHWRYIFDRLLGEIRAVSCRMATALPFRRDEQGARYAVDVKDTALAQFELADGVVAQVSASWATRVRRDDLLQIQVDGTLGSAVAGLHRCFIQPLVATPKPFFDPERPQPMVFAAQWQEMPDLEPVQNGYRAGWELFLRHVA